MRTNIYLCMRVKMNFIYPLLRVRHIPDFVLYKNVPSKQFNVASSWAIFGPIKLSLGKIWLVHGYGIPGSVHTRPKNGTPNKIKPTLGICLAYT
jgi:hypothetical protein